MNHDEQSYQRAAAAALFGLILQLALALGVTLVGIWTESKAVHAATWYFYGGLPIWLALWILFNQHRLERQESLEAEQLAEADASAAALFDEAGQQLALARKRLDNLYKYGLNITALLVSVYLLTVGLIQLVLNYRAFAASATDFTSSAQPANSQQVGILLAIFAGMAFLTFIAARYVAGMTRVAEWSPLRGGAGYLMGNALTAVLFVAASTAAYFANPQGFAWLALFVPALMTLLGVEVVLSFIFGVYRPRRQGEVPRLAFDSRLLGWLTSPESFGKILGDTINYQFGFEISRSWFYQLLGKALTPLIVACILILLGMSSVVIVRPHEQAVITTFGGLDRIAEPGMSFKLPWPMARADRYATARVHQLLVGSTPEGQKPGMSVLWTNEHMEGEERYLVTAPAQSAGEGDRDEGAVTVGELAAVNLAVEYRIADLEQYVRSVPTPEVAGAAPPLLAAIAMRELNAYVAMHTIDELLAGDRMTAGEDLRQRIQAAVDKRQLGLQIVLCAVVNVHPPQKSEVAAKFLEQINASQEREVKIERAKRDAIKTLVAVAGTTQRARDIDKLITERYDLDAVRQEANRQGEASSVDLAALEKQIAAKDAEIEQAISEAGGEAAQLLAEGRARRWQRPLSAQAAAALFPYQMAMYEKAPDYFRWRSFLDVLADGTRDRRKVVVGFKTDDPALLRLNLEEAGSGLDFFDKAGE